MGRVDGKLALVTGAAQGLGAATSWMLAREGARVLLTDFPVATLNTLLRAVPALRHAAPAARPRGQDRREVRQRQRGRDFRRQRQR